MPILQYPCISKQKSLCFRLRLPGEKDAYAELDGIVRTREALFVGEHKTCAQPRSGKVKDGVLQEDGAADEVALEV